MACSQTPTTPLGGQAVQQGIAVGVKGAGAVMGVGVKDGAHQYLPSFWAGALFTSQMPMQTKHQCPQILPAEQGLAVEHGAQQHVDHRVHEAEDGRCG